MGTLEVEIPHLRINVQESNNEANPVPKRRKGFKWWLRMSIYTIFVLASQAIATLLTRHYYDKGGKSNWLATLVQICGFPILLPYYFVPSWRNRSPTPKNRTVIAEEKPPPSPLVLAAIYAILGMLIAADYYLYILGIAYLPVSTFSLVSASQLAFNAVFSFFLNKQKFTFLIFNCLVLLIISAILLGGATADADASIVPESKHLIGFICTVGASAGYALTLSDSSGIHKGYKERIF